MRKLVYTFTREDHEYIRKLARQRRETAKYSSKPFVDYNGNSDLWGAYGEYAFAKLVNYPLPISHSVGDGKVDFKNDIFTIQVRSSQHTNGHFFDNSSPEWKFTAQIGVLMIVDKSYRYASFAGWIGRPKFDLVATHPSWGKRGDERAVSQELLCKRSWLLRNYLPL